MKKAVWSGLLAATAFLMMSTPAFAQANDNAAINVTVNVNARAKLTLGTSAITWADADPDVTATLSSGAISVDVKARTSGGSTVALTVLASDDLKSGSQVITINNLTWTGSGASFAASGTSNKTTSQNVVSFTNSGNRSGSQTYSLPNSWSYATGSYTATLNYTLVAP